MRELLDEIEIRLNDLLRRAAAGEDVPPALRFRLEGMLLAARLCGAADEAELYACLDRAHETHFGFALTPTLWEGWQALHPFPSLPLYSRRAPVSASTPD